MSVKSKTLPNGVEVVDYVEKARSLVGEICKIIVKKERERKRPKIKA